MSMTKSADWSIINALVGKLTNTVMLARIQLKVIRSHWYHCNQTLKNRMHRHKYLVKENYYGDSITLQESLQWFEQVLQIFKNRCFQLYILIILNDLFIQIQMIF